jgi:hypothetical protein
MDPDGAGSGSDTGQRTPPPATGREDGQPLLNEYGKVVAVTTATQQSGQNVNFAIASKHIVGLISRSRPPASLSQMLNETLVAEPIGETTIPVPSRQSATLQFTVAQQQGAVLQGSHTISGGRGRDAGVLQLVPTTTSS